MNVGSSEPASDGKDAAVADIVVPDSYLGFLRLLLFLYTGDFDVSLLASHIGCTCVHWISERRSIDV